MLLTSQSAVEISMLDDFKTRMGHEVAVYVPETLPDVPPHILVGRVLLGGDLRAKPQMLRL